MRVYFVRHGQSKGNEGNFSQVRETPLSEKGIKQAEFLAQRFKTIKIDTLISSSYERARSTADVIGKVKGINVDYSELFIERRKPSQLWGISFHDIEQMKKHEEYERCLYTGVEKYSDEETFQELKERALKALEHLEGLNVENVAVVTHEFFLTVLVSVMLFGKKLTVEQFSKITKFLKADNTSISICTKDAVGQDNIDKSNIWRLYVWNDNAHLGEV